MGAVVVDSVGAAAVDSVGAAVVDSVGAAAAAAADVGVGVAEEVDVVEVEAEELPEDVAAADEAAVEECEAERRSSSKSTDWMVSTSREAKRTPCVHAIWSRENRCTAKSEWLSMYVHLERCDSSSFHAR